MKREGNSRRVYRWPVESGIDRLSRPEHDAVSSWFHKRRRTAIVIFSAAVFAASSMVCLVAGLVALAYFVNIYKPVKTIAAAVPELAAVRSELGDFTPPSLHEVTMSAMDGSPTSKPEYAVYFELKSEKNSGKLEVRYSLSPLEIGRPLISSARFRPKYSTEEMELGEELAAAVKRINNSAGER